MGFRVPPPPVRAPRPPAMTELEAIALGAPTPADLVAWIEAGDDSTLWEFVIRARQYPAPLPGPARDPGVMILR